MEEDTLTGTTWRCVFDISLLIARIMKPGRGVSGQSRGRAEPGGWEAFLLLANFANSGGTHLDLGSECIQKTRRPVLRDSGCHELRAGDHQLWEHGCLTTPHWL